MNIMNKLKEILAETFEIEVSAIGNDFSQDNCETWDSIGHLNLIVAIEEEFNISIEPEEIIKMTSLKTIMNYLNEKLAV